MGCLVLSGCLSIDIAAPSDIPPTDSQPPVAVTPDLSTPTSTSLSASPSPTETADQPITPDKPTPPPTTPPTGQPTELPTEQPTQTNPSRPSPSGDLPAACFDEEFTIGGFRWRESLDWTYLATSTPADLDTDAVLGVLEQSFANITGASNDCGRGDAVAAEASYAGTTALQPCDGAFADGTNVVGFGSLPRRARGRTLAIACPYLSGNRIVEADILINEDVEWALNLGDCRGFREMLEATMTHEIGHAFGLGHVSERRHGELTMSTRSNGSCNLDEASLGLGDLLGLEELYPLGD